MIFVSPDSARRIERVESFILGLPQGEECLLVASTRRVADELVHRLAKREGAVFGVHPTSFERLALSMASDELARDGLIPAPASVLEAAAARVIASGDLGRFEPLRESQRFPAALVKTLNELRLARIPPSKVDGELGDLFQRYVAELRAMEFADRAQALETATRNGLPRRRLAILDVQLRWPGEADLLRWIVSQSVDVIITVPEGDVQTLRLLPDEVERDESSSPGELSVLKADVFSRRRHSLNDNGQVAFFSAPGEGRECVEIARRVLDEARQGVAFDDIAVVTRSAAYGPHLETAFRRANIPAYFFRGTRKPEPAGRAFAILLRCAQEGLSAKRFAEYLSLDQTPVPEHDGVPPRDPATWSDLAREDVGFGEEAKELEPSRPGHIRVPRRWEELLVEASVLRGADRWRRRLDGLRATYELQGERLEPDSPRQSTLKKIIEELNQLQAFALPLIEDLERLPQGAADWGIWLGHLQRLAGRALCQPEPVLSHLVGLRPMAGRGVKVTLETVISVLEDRLLTLRQEPPPRRYGRVFVGTPESLRGRTFEVVFIPGLAEGMFPQKLVEDPLLSDSRRRDLGDGLPTREEQALEERLRLRLCLGAARTRVHISYPRIEPSQGRQRVPSFYALEILAVTRGALPNFKELESEAVHASRTRLDWPAPVDPARAIDAFEHDLAVLRRLFSDPEKATGRARYLLEANGYLARSLRRRWRRWAPAWSAVDGLVEPPPQILDILQKQRLGKKPYSPTSLQKFSVCPYRFFLSRIQQLGPCETFDSPEQMPALVRGSLVHEVQARFMLSSRSLDKDELNDVLDVVAREYEERLAPPLPRVWLDEVERLRIDLQVWLRQLRDEQDQWRPFAFEWSFGLSLGELRDPKSQREPAVLDERFQICGSVDWIDVHCATGELRVTDHKTGRALRGRLGAVNGGEVLQPVLYAMAAEQGLESPVREGRLSYCTTRGGFNTKAVSLGERERQAALQVLGAVDQAIEEGFFPAYPREKACTYCDFQSVCGPWEEVRTAEKLADSRLDEISELRKLP